MPSPLLCKVLVHGQPCNYECQGATSKAQIADLHRHQQGHVDAANQAKAGK